MYTQQDKKDIKSRIIKYTVITLLVFAALMALYVAGMINRWEIGVSVIGCALFAELCFAWLVFLWPCIRYNMFLKDMDGGLTREIAGSIVEISQTEDLQDGVRVLPVRVQLANEDDERIVYLNASKAEGFPKPGAAVRLMCFGRHIKEVVSEA